MLCCVVQVRDQRVRLEADPELGLMVQPVSEEQKAAAAQQGQGKSLQFMMSFTMKDWEMMKLCVPEDDCIMPHRGQAQGAAAAAAGGAARSRGADVAAGSQQQQQAKRARRA